MQAFILLFALSFSLLAQEAPSVNKLKNITLEVVVEDVELENTPAGEEQWRDVHFSEFRQIPVITRGNWETMGGCDLKRIKHGVFSCVVENANIADPWRPLAWKDHYQMTISNGFLSKVCGNVKIYGEDFSFESRGVIFKKYKAKLKVQNCSVVK